MIGSREIFMQHLKNKIATSRRRLISVGNEFVRVKDKTSARQKLNILIQEISAQIVYLSEQNAELMRKLEKQK
jgi:hypothetical protein